MPHTRLFKSEQLRTIISSFLLLGMGATAVAKDLKNEKLQRRKEPVMSHACSKVGTLTSRLLFVFLLLGITHNAGAIDFDDTAPGTSWFNPDIWSSRSVPTINDSVRINTFRGLIDVHIESQQAYAGTTVVSTDGWGGA